MALSRSLSLPKLGNTGVSSLIKSASTLTNELSTYNDTIQQLQFENSAKTQADYEAYATYLSSRIGNLEGTGNITDATKALNLRQTVTGALHSYMSADIQRATIAVLDGQGTNDDKLNAIGAAFQQLYAVGDISAAQSYEEQYYSFYQTVQLQKQQAADALSSSASASSSAYKTAVTDAVGQIQNNIKDANAAFAAQGPKLLDQESNAYLKDQTAKTGAKMDGSASIFSALAGQVGMVNSGVQLNGTTKYLQGTYTSGSILDIYTQAIVADPTHASTYQQNIDNYLNGGTGVALPGEGNKTITYNALMNTVYAGNSNHSPYGIVQGADGSWQIQAEHVTGYTFGRDQNNNVKLMADYAFFNTPIKGVNPNGSVQKGSPADAMKKAGINVKESSDGDWTFQATNQSTFLGKLFGTYPVQGAVQKDGTVEFMGAGGKLFQMVQDSKGLFGVQQLNAFGQVINANVGGQYGFTPDKTNALAIKGSTAFMTKVLGDTATPEKVGNKLVYQANGKIYQLATDTRGLKALQEIDKNGKVINNNVAGQYGFNPNSLSRTDQTQSKGQNFIQTLLSGAQDFGSAYGSVNSPDFHSHDENSISHFAAPWLGVSTLINNAQIMQTINQAHDQAMIALATQQRQAQLALQVVPAAPQPALTVAKPAAQPRLTVAQAAPASTQGSTYNPQQAAGGVQGGNYNPQSGAANPQQTLKVTSANPGTIRI